MANAYQDLTPEDFEDVSTPTVTLDTTSKPARKLTAEEIEPSAIKRGLAGAGRAMVNKYRGLTGQPAAEGAELEEDTAGSIGAMLPDAIASMAVPARVIPQAAFGMATKAIEPASNALERVVAGLKGGAEYGGGQALASGLVRGANALAGNLTREGEVAKAAKLGGIDLTTGDILDSRLLRLAEEKSFMSPSRNQAEQITNAMNQNADPITEAIMAASNAANAKVKDASARLDSYIAQNALPAIKPVNTASTLRDILRHNPASLNSVDDVVLRDKLIKLAESNPNKVKLRFEELDDLRKAVGPVMANIKRQAQSGNTNVTSATANRWAGKEGLYASIMKDMEEWGTKGKLPEEALAAHQELNSTFKNEVLPLRNHPLSGKILDGGYTRPEDLLRDLTSPRNKSIVNDLYGRLDQAGKNAFDALRMAKRGSRDFVRGESQAVTLPEKLALFGAGATTPMWASSAISNLPWLAAAIGAEQAMVHGVNSPIGRAIAAGVPEAVQNPLGNAAIQATLRATLPRGVLAPLSDRK